MIDGIRSGVKMQQVVDARSLPKSPAKLMAIKSDY